jgi:ADP-L-glycero-D-manno-heptose 6-epimerase
VQDQAIIITGASGFIGSCVVKELNLRGFHNLFLIDRLGSAKKWMNLVGKSFNQIIPVEESISWLSHSNENVQAILHLGACSSTTEINADYLLSNNTYFSQQLATLAYERGWRFIYASSAATYGDGKLSFQDDDSLIDQFHPLNMYGYSKHLFDLWLKRKGWLKSFVGLKYFNVYGPNEWHKGRMASHVLKMVAQVKEGRISLFKSNHPDYQDGEQARDFIYVKDAARMTCDFLQNTVAGLYNVGRGQAHTWNELAYGVMKSLNQQVPIDYIEMPKDLSLQYQNYTCACMNKWIKAGLNPPQWGLQDSLNDYIQQHLLTSNHW